MLVASTELWAVMCDGRLQKDMAHFDVGDDGKFGP
jgi:hypothetical protein